MFQRLGEFYERKGYFAMSHSRLRRFEILLEFLEEEQIKELPLLKEGLVFDLYYRENSKKRPAWADDFNEWKQVTRAYCKNGTQSHVERFSYRFPDKRERSIKKLPKREEKPVYVLFDYTERDPLDYQAKVSIVPLEEQTEQ